MFSIIDVNNNNNKQDTLDPIDVLKLPHIELQNTLQNIIKNQEQGDKQIICRIKGGLANQLFQIAATISLSKDLDINYSCEKLSSSPTIFKNKDVYWNTLFKNMQTHESNALAGRFIGKYQEKGYRYNSEIMVDLIKILGNNIDIIDIDGYFQSWKYFYHHFDEIKDILFNPKICNQIHQKYLDLINPEQINISIHFRLTDYRRLDSFTKLWTTDYYQKAFQTILNKLDTTTDQNINLYIFTDEPKFIHDNITKILNINDTQNININFVSNYGMRDYEELLLMSNFPNIITANSTFSWWAAFLASYNSEKNNISNNTLITAPNGDLWFKEDYTDFFPTIFNWIIL